jgi:ion channel-forming bestrophin family protein
MHAGKHYTLKEVLYWTRREIYVLLLLGTVPTVLYAVWDIKLTLPWLPIALIGTAVAFIVGFKNNATYGRLWEARQVWGAIINASRSWGIMVKDFVTTKNSAMKISEDELKKIHTRLIYRHVGWLTALRFQLREPRAWENLNASYNAEYRRLYRIPEHENKLDVELAKFLSEDDMKYVLSKKNRATQLITLQSGDLRTLAEIGLIDNFRHVEMENMLVNLYDQQGKCERIKNFPYPRQFATINLFFVRLFTILVPFGMLQEFDKLGDHFVWLTIPFTTLVCWVFLTMEKIGEATENPFEGTANDIPMAALCRTIEIDLREMLEERELPPPVTAVNNILM